MQQYLLIFIIIFALKNSLTAAVTCNSEEECREHCEEQRLKMGMYLRRVVKKGQSCMLRRQIIRRDDDIKFEPFLNKSIYISRQEKVNWFAAAERCHELDAGLIDIESEAEFDALLKKLNVEKSYWTSVTDLNIKDKYYSMTTGYKANFLKWHKNEPNNYFNKERCIEIRSRKQKLLMNDADCKFFSYFVCQK